MIRLTILTLLISLTVLVGCPGPVHVYDEITIRHWEEAQTLYIEDIARAAGVDDPTKLTEKNFPLAVVLRDPVTGQLVQDEDGYVITLSLTWDEFSAAIAVFDSYIRYEKKKRNADGSKPGDSNNPSE